MLKFPRIYRYMTRQRSSRCTRAQVREDELESVTPVTTTAREQAP